MQFHPSAHRYSTFLLMLSLALAMGGCKSAERRAADQIARAQYAATNGDLVTAAVSLRKALLLRDDNPDAWAMLGQIEQQRERLGDAFNAFQRSDELKPSDPAILRALCYTGYVVGAATEASDAADRLLAISPGDSSALSVKALLALDQRDTKTAAQSIDAILRTSLQDETGIMLKARAAAIDKDVPGALKLVNEASAKSARPDGLQVLALQLYRLSGDVDGLRKTFPIVLSLTPESPDLHADYANFLFKTGETRKATRLLFDAMLKAPRDGQFLNWAFAILDTYASAGAPLFDDRVYSAPPSLLRTFAARYLVDHGAAADALRLVSANKPIDPADRGIYARALLGLGRGAEARQTVAALLNKQGSQDADALVVRAYLDLADGRSDRAVIDAQAAVVSDGGSVAARIALARAFEARKNEALARSTLVDAANDLPHSRTILAALLDFLQKKGDMDGQLGAIRTFADANSGDPRGWKMLEAICAKQHNSACVATAQDKARDAASDFYAPNPNRPNRERGLFSPIKRPT